MATHETKAVCGEDLTAPLKMDRAHPTQTAHQHSQPGERTHFLVVPGVHSNRSVEEVLNHVSLQPQSISRIHPSFFTTHQKSQRTWSYKFLSVLAPRSVERFFGSWRSTTTTSIARQALEWNPQRTRMRETNTWWRDLNAEVKKAIPTWNSPKTETTGNSLLVSWPETLGIINWLFFSKGWFMFVCITWWFWLIFDKRIYNGIKY